MALVPHKITALAESDADGTDGKNIVAGAVVSLYDVDGNAVTLFDDASGSNGSTAKQTDVTGQVVVWVTAGEYDEEVNGSIKRRINIGGNSVISYEDTASLQSSRPNKTGQRAENRERANAQYVLAASGYTALAGDITAANGRVWQLIGGSYNQSLTVNIPTDYATMQDAIDYYHNKVFFTDGFELIVNIESGHQPTTGVSVSNGDYGYVRITSDDAEVVIPSNFTGPQDDFEGVTGHLITGSNARMPTLGCLFNMGGFGSDGYYGVYSSIGFIEEGCGVKNAGRHGLHFRSGNVFAYKTIWDGANSIGIRAQHCAQIAAQQSTAKNCCLNEPSGAAVRASRGSSINFLMGDCSGSFGNGVLAIRGEVVAQGVVASNAVFSGFYAQQAGVIRARDGVANNCGLDGVRALHASTVDFKFGEAKGNAGDGINADNLSRVNAANSDLSGNGRDAVFAATGSSVECSSSDATSSSRYGIRAESGAKVSSLGGDFSGAAQRGASASSTGVIHGFSCNFRTVSGADNSVDMVVVGGGQIHAYNSLGGTSETVNTITQNGVIYYGS
jgi:hypothetical protein